MSKFLKDFLGNSDEPGIRKFLQVSERADIAKRAYLEQGIIPPDIEIEIHGLIHSLHIANAIYSLIVVGGTGTEIVTPTYTIGGNSADTKVSTVRKNYTEYAIIKKSGEVK